ncbi:condensation domain-containing protein, partial [Streptomyces sp. NPDC001274]
MGESSVEARLLSRMKRSAEAARIVRADREDGPLPLSFAQQRLWFLDRLTPDSADYLVPTVLRVRGALDVPALGTALSGLVARHEVLRTAFPADGDGAPRQVIGAPWPVEVTVHDLRAEPDAEMVSRSTSPSSSASYQPASAAAADSETIAPGTA